MWLSFLLLVSVEIILIIWLGILSYICFRAYSTYKHLTEDIDSKDFASVLRQLKHDQKLALKERQEINDHIKDVKQQIIPYVQQIGFVRYNPFGNTGGDQSFCLCLLDGRGNGILLTSLHARQQTRIYTKEIVNYKTKDSSELSKEEQKCLQSAQKWSKP